MSGFCTSPEAKSDTPTTLSQPHFSRYARGREERCARHRGAPRTREPALHVAETPSVGPSADAPRPAEADGASGMRDGIIARISRSSPLCPQSNVGPTAQRQSYEKARYVDAPAEMAQVGLRLIQAKRNDQKSYEKRQSECVASAHLHRSRQRRVHQRRRRRRGRGRGRRRRGLLRRRQRHEGPAARGDPCRQGVSRCFGARLRGSM